MNLDKHEVLAPTPSQHTCGAMHFFVKKHLAQQEVSHDCWVSTQWKRKFYHVTCPEEQKILAVPSD